MKIAILDEIDTLLAEHYKFTVEALDFIINCDIKYRLGSDTEPDSEQPTIKIYVQNLWKTQANI